MAQINFVPRIDDAPYGVAEQVSPLIRRVIAENPSKFTYRGTGTYIVGHGTVTVIDPGPELDSHRQAIERAIQGEQVKAIVVTHCHSDHVGDERVGWKGVGKLKAALQHVCGARRVIVLRANRGQ